MLQLFLAMNHQVWWAPRCQEPEHALLCLPQEAQAWSVAALPRHEPSGLVSTKMSRTWTCSSLFASRGPSLKCCSSSLPWNNWVWCAPRCGFQATIIKIPIVSSASKETEHALLFDSRGSSLKCCSIFVSTEGYCSSPKDLPWKQMLAVAHVSVALTLSCKSALLRLNLVGLFSVLVLFLWLVLNQSCHIHSCAVFFLSSQIKTGLMFVGWRCIL